MARIMVQAGKRVDLPTILTSSVSANALHKKPLIFNGFFHLCACFADGAKLAVVL